jgi:lipoprotein-anchoring transpeptidase ErfK/SrfK
MKRYRTSLTLISAAFIALVNTGCGTSGGTLALTGNTVKPDQSTQVSNQEGNQQTTPSKPSYTDWTKPSGGDYPDIKGLKDIWIDASIGEQRIYIKHGDQTIYTMITSSGLDTNPDTTTPKGTYYVQAERGKWFYTAKYKEGAEYWVSWKNHGEFLFHSVPMDKDHHVLVEDAKKLGQKDSHGCFHLTIPDAKWIYDNIPKGTKVVIRD